MKPLVVLIATFAFSLIVLRISRKEYRIAFSARIAMSVMLFFTAIGHFVFTEGMEMMMPAIVPFKRVIVIGTGAIEILAATGLQIKRLRKLTGILLILFFICILPANIYAAIYQVDLQSVTSKGPGLEYLWFRIPLQLFFIGWVYVSSIRESLNDQKTL